MEIVKRILQFFDKKPKFHILSDSHGEAFYELDFRRFSVKPSYCVVQGATASGLANPNSKTKALPIFKNYLNDKVNKNDYLLFELGEVDCGFALWLIAEKKKIDILEQLEYALNNYFDFLIYASNYSANPIIVLSAILPTIKDGTFNGEVANLRKDVKATLKERTELTLIFNKKLKNFCDQNSYIFIDLDKSLLDNETGLVKESFRNEDIRDHHLNPIKLAALINDNLNFLNEKSH